MQPAAMNPRLRFLHTSPDAPPLDVYVDDAPAATHLGYGQLSAYVSFSPERHRLRVLPAGIVFPESELIDIQLQKLEPGLDYTLALVGERKDLQVAPLEDAASDPGPAHAQVRVLHASPDAPALDVGIKGGPRLFPQVPLSEVTAYRQVPAGTVDIEFRRAGHAEVVTTLPGYTLAGGHLYTLVVLGRVHGQPPLAVMPVVQMAHECVPTR